MVLFTCSRWPSVRRRASRLIDERLENCVAMPVGIATSSQLQQGMDAMTIKQNFSRRDDDIDLNALLGTVLSRKWLIITVTGLFFALSVAYAVLATPIYEASAMVQVEQKTPTLPGLSDLTETLGTSVSQAVTEIALLTSRTVVGQAVDNLNLDV